MGHIWELMDPSKERKWRAIFKALSLLEFLVKNGPERVIEDTRDNIGKLRRMGDFSKVEDGKDRGQVLIGCGLNVKFKIIFVIINPTKLGYPRPGEDNRRVGW